MTVGDKKKLKLMSWNVRLPSTGLTGFLMVTHPPIEGACEFGWGDTPTVYDQCFLEELCDYYESRKRKETITGESLTWDAIIPTHQEFIDLLVARDYSGLNDYLKVMFTKPLTHGIAQGDFYYNRLLKNEDEIVSNTGFGVYDKFITLFEALGIIPMFSPERYQIESEFLKYYTVSTDKYLDALEDHLGYKIQAPKYQGQHFGIKTERHGLFTDRDIMALGVAIRISESYWNRRDITIADLGGGVGHLSYWLYQLGYKNLSYVDLPTTTVAAKYFMRTNAPEIDLKYIAPEDFDGKFDLVVNLDGITTYGRNAAENYAAVISKNANHFMSINREHDEYRVFDIFGENMRRISRNPFWYRRGYAEEDYVRIP